jgi:hypothetical protein
MKNKGTQFEQLSMIAPAQEVKSRITNSSDRKWDANETLDGMWDRKLAEAKAPGMVQPTDVQWQGGKGVRVPVGEPYRNPIHGAGTFDSIQDNGYDGTPIPMLHRVGGGASLGDGHHRLAAAAAQGKDVLMSHSDQASYEVRRKNSTNQEEWHDTRLGSDKD